MIGICYSEFLQRDNNFDWRILDLFKELEFRVSVRKAIPCNVPLGSDNYKKDIKTKHLESLALFCLQPKWGIER